MRKEIDLTAKIIKTLKTLADKDKRKLKNYMEKILEDHAENNQKKVNN